MNAHPDHDEWCAKGGRNQLLEAKQKGGRITGPINGGTHDMSPEAKERLREGARRGGRIGGRNQPLEVKQRAGRITGRANVESGKFLGAGKSGRRLDLGLYMRSRAEANVARILNLLVARGDVAAWRYEPGWVALNGHDYRPDFLVLYPDGQHEWWEVKGYWWPKARRQVIEFCRRFPGEHLIVPDYYGRLTEQFKDLIPEWEDGCRSDQPASINLVGEEGEQTMATKRVKKTPTKRERRSVRQAAHAATPPPEVKVRWNHTDAVRLTKALAQGKSRSEAIQVVAETLGVSRSLAEEMLRGDHHVRHNGGKRQSIPLQVAEDVAARARALTESVKPIAPKRSHHRKVEPKAEPEPEVEPTAEPTGESEESGLSGEAEETGLEGHVPAGELSGVC
jgi:hypothetical protein